MATKKTVLLFVISMLSMPFMAGAQTRWTGVDMPFMPKRDTNHIHILRIYAISDTSTMERKLLWTEEYDHHGYRVSPHILLSYNEKDQLVQYVELQKHFSVKDQREYTDTTSSYQISYTPDGVVKHVKSSFYHGEDSTVNTYDLIAYETHPQYGVLDCSYRNVQKMAYHYEDGPSVYYDTSYYRREFDDRGNLVKMEINETGLNDIEYVIHHYYYDASGRLAYCTGRYYEFGDSLVYQYDDKGKVTGIVGKYFDLDSEADVKIRFRDDGSMMDELAVSHPYEEDAQGEDGYNTDYVKYDSHGVMVWYQTNRAEPYIKVFEIEYWE